jgi:hypothetical protein
MSYIQRFGLSRNSPLNAHTKYHCEEGSKNDAGECVGWEYNQGKEKRDAEKKQENEDLYNLKGPLTDAQQAKRDMMMISSVNKGEREWGRDGKNWNTYPLKDRPVGWSLPNAKGPDGQDQGNTFAQEDLNKADERIDLKTKIDQVKGGETWKNSKYNKNPKLGFDENGQATYNSRGDKMFLGNKDVTEEYYKKHNKAGGKNQTFSNKLDYTQDALGVAGFTPGYGAFADGANALLSGFRGVGSLLGAKSDDGKTTGDHFKNMAANAFYAVPVAGDLAAAAKVNKFKKYIPTTKGMTDWTKGNNIVTKNIGKTNKTGTKVNYNPQPISGAAKNWESKSKNLLRGVAGFATGKNYNKFGQGIETVLGKNKFADVVKMGTSSKFLVDKPQKALGTLGDVGNALTETTNKGLDSIRGAYTNISGSEVAQGGFGKDKKTEITKNPAASIIANNNKKSNRDNLIITG